MKRNTEQEKQQKKKKRGMWVFLIVILLLVAVYLANEYLLDDMALQQEGAPVSVTRGSISQPVQADGAIEADNEERVYAPMNVRIENMLVKAGDTVEAGTPILSFSPRQAENEINLLLKEEQEIENRLSQENSERTNIVYSTQTGRIRKIFASANQDTTRTMENYGGLFLLSPDDRLEVTFTATQPVDEDTPLEIIIGDKRILDYSVVSISGPQEAPVVTLRFEEASYDISEHMAMVVVRDDDTPIGWDIPIDVVNQMFIPGPSGIVSRINVYVNSWVNVNSNLLELRESTYSSKYQELLNQKSEVQNKIKTLREYARGKAIEAPVAGVVKDLPSTEGMDVAEGSLLFSISGTDVYSLTVEVDELNISSVDVGDFVSIFVEAVNDMEYTGTVAKKSGMGQYENGMTYFDVTIQLNEVDRILPGMSARAEILVENRQDVLLIPNGAINWKGAEAFVTPISGPDGYPLPDVEDIPVSLGIRNSTEAEVLSGLNEGDYIWDKNAEPVGSDQSAQTGAGT